MKYLLPATLLFLLVFSYSNFNAQEVDGGNGHSIMLDPYGVVWTVGRNDHGQLGNNSFEDSSVPVRVEGLPKITAISRGYDHSLAVDEKGSIWAWGRNNYGQLCNTNLEDTPLPQRIDIPGRFVTVEGGLAHSIALKDDGSVWAWGHNFYAELGSGNREHSIGALKVRSQDPEDPENLHKPLTGIRDIKCVGYHGLALDSLGQVWAWGGNTSYQLGHEQKGHQPWAAIVENLPKIQAIAAGWHHSLVLDSEGGMWQWGTDQSLMHTPDSRFIRTPTYIDSVPPMTQVACGSWHSMSVDQSGQVWTWGCNQKGMLGTNDTIPSAIPVKAAGMSCAQNIGAGCFQSLVVDSAGNMWSFGGNHNGQLAANHENHEITPSQTFFAMDRGSLPAPENTPSESVVETESNFSIQRIWLIISPILLVLLATWNIRLRTRMRPSV